MTLLLLAVCQGVGLYRDGSQLIPRREFAELLEHLNNPAWRGVLLLGDPGAGKTTLLAMVGEELPRRGRLVLGVSLGGVRDSGGLGARVLDAAERRPHAAVDFGLRIGPLSGGAPGLPDAEDADEFDRTVRSSAGSRSLAEAAARLNRASGRLPSPVLLLDGLDESVYPGRLASAIEELSLELNGWKFVVSMTPEAARQVRHFDGFAVLELRGFAAEDAASILGAYALPLPAEIIDRITEFTGGNPLLLQVLARDLRRSASLAGDAEATSSLQSVLEWLVNQAISASPDPANKGELLEELALAGGHTRIARLAAKTQLTEGEVRGLLGAPQTRALVVLDEEGGTAALFHETLRDVIISRRILKSRFRLADLKFGAEEAERDELLDASYVQRPDAEAILGRKLTIVVGDRGSGKSAIFRKLAETATATDGPSNTTICPVTNTSDLLHRIIADEKAWLDTDALRAAWLVVIASVAATAIPPSAPKKLRRDAAAIRAALGSLPEPASLPMRTLRAAGGILGGTTLKFTVGPAELDVQLPSGSGGRPGKTSVDVGAFIHDANRLLGRSSRRVVMMFDRIDETFKYDRARQQAIVQALFQAEAQVSLLDDIRLVVFIRTDLFELYDIQEKNKLVSRRLTLDWTEEEWLQVLVRRVLANEPLQHLAGRLRLADVDAEARAALEVLFPAELEGQPVDRWLVDSLRNGNGDVSPRLAVLLLYLARERAARPGAVVSTLPLFSAAEAGEAMTRLSDLSFSEVVNDFKVAPSFLQNLRAGKLETFALADVRELFDEAEGKIGDQVRLLERLGFLERIVREQNGVRTSLFRIPKLYSRCFDYA
jgi:hypothetical protein